MVLLNRYNFDDAFKLRVGAKKEGLVGFTEEAFHPYVAMCYLLVSDAKCRDVYF